MLRPSRDRVAFAALATGTVGLGLLVHARVFALPDFVRDKVGDALWATMVAWCIGAVAPGARVGRRSIAAIAVCWAVEASQPWHAPWLEAIRATTLGSLVLGRGFDPGDLPAYAVGVIAAALGETIVGSLRARRSTSPGDAGEPPTRPSETGLAEIGRAHV